MITLLTYWRKSPALTRIRFLAQPPSEPAARGARRARRASLCAGAEPSEPVRARRRRARRRAHFATMDHTPACASRPEEEWGRLLVEQHEGAPLGVVPLYGGEAWNAAGSRMRLRHIPRCRPGRRQRGMVQQLTNVDVYCNGERLGAPSCQALVWHGDTITFGAAFPRATLVTHIVEINPLFLRLSLTKRPQRPRALPTRLAPPAGVPPRGPSSHSQPRALRHTTVLSPTSHVPISVSRAAVPRLYRDMRCWTVQ